MAEPRHQRPTLEELRTAVRLHPHRTVLRLLASHHARLAQHDQVERERSAPTPRASGEASVAAEGPLPMTTMLEQDPDAEETVSVQVGDRVLTGPKSLVDEMREELAAQERRAALRRERWGEGSREGMARLAGLFPTLAEAFGTAPWSVDRLLIHLLSGARTGGSGHAIRFLLQVWSLGTDWTAYLREVAQRVAPYTRTSTVEGTAAELDQAAAKARRAGHKTRRVKNGGREELEIVRDDPEDAALWRHLQEYQAQIRTDLVDDAKERGARLSGEPLRAKGWERACAAFAEAAAPFNVVAAFSCWDDEHRAAFTAWTEAPFWP